MENGLQHMNLLKWAGIGLLVSMLSCKSTQRVVKYVNENADFENYHTFSLVHYKTGKKELTDQGKSFLNEIESEITGIMEERGYQKASKGDLILRYETISGINTTTNAPNYYGNPYLYDPYDPMNQRRTQKHLVGLLLIELKDSETKKLVWQGSVDLKYSNDEAANRDLVVDSIHRIFSTYPYKAGSKQPLDFEEDR